MKSRGIFVALLAASLLALPVAAQEEAGDVGMVVFIKVKPGMEKQFEEGAKKHLAWHGQQKDAWTWNSWQTISGENTGTYGYGTFGHRWADFDKPGVSAEADMADAAVNVTPYVQSAVVQYYVLLPKVSRPRQSTEPVAMETVLIFRLRMGATEEFMNAIAKVTKAIEKTKWAANYEWYALVNGGEHPTFVLVLPRENWAAMAPPATSFEAMLEEAFGRTEAAAILKTFDRTIKSETSEMIRNRPDLSYIPAPAGK